MPGRRRPRFRDSLRRPRPDRAQLTRYFVGIEGRGERALARWIESLCVAAGHKILFKFPGTGSGGGSTFDVVQHTVTNRNRSRHGPYAGTLVFLDEDRRTFDGPAAEELARREGIHLVWQTPNIEGVLLRLFPGQENRHPPADQTSRELERYWPNYRKNDVSAADLRERLSLYDLQRAAQFDDNLLMLLHKLGIAEA
jgi:hypothetical protein